MQDFELKKLISNLTGVPMVRTAMPLLSGQTLLRNRKLIWHGFDPTQIPASLPDKMKMEIGKFFQDYSAHYKQYVPEANIADFVSMMFAWYAEDGSVTEADMANLQKSNVPDKEKLLQVAKFVTDNGVPLAKSRAEWEENPSGKPSYNGSDVHRNHFSWAWGGKELPMEDEGRRKANGVPEDKLKDEAWLQKQVYDKNAVLVSVTTAEVGGAYGIFFTDGTDVLPVMPEAMIREMKQYMASQDKPLTPDTPVMKHLLKAYGGFEKFFIFRSFHDPSGKGMNWAFTPGEKRFLLDSRSSEKALAEAQGAQYQEREWNLETDIKDLHPKGIHWKEPGTGENARLPKPANDGRHRGMFVQKPAGSAGNYKKNQTIDPRVFVAMIRANGTLYWQNEANPSIQVNMTEQQVDHFNAYKGKVYALSEPGYRRWGFDINDPEGKANYQKYLDDCVYLDKLRNFIVETSGRTHVASQKYQVVMVAPRFTFGKQVGEEETAGFMFHPTTESENKNVESHPGLFTGKRDEWVIEKTEYNISTAREEKFKNTKDAPQSTHGQAALTDQEHGMNADDAVKKAVRLYRIPASVVPPDSRIQAAQAAFDAARNSFKPQAPQQPIDTQVGADNTQAPPVDPFAGQSQSTPPVKPTPQVSAPMPANPPKPTVETDEFAKMSKDILERIKKLG